MISKLIYKQDGGRKGRLAVVLLLRHDLFFGIYRYRHLTVIRHRMNYFPSL